MTVTEAAIVAATWDLARQGIYVEPTSAGPAAAAAELRATGVINASETTVVVMTGSGLKATQRLGELQGVLKS
jgi:threonine synthase